MGGSDTDYLFRIYGLMIRRCHNPDSDAFPYYGGRGIEVCEKWRKSFDAFFKDVGHRPTEKHSLDRKDNDKGYHSENCRWATKSVQNRNKRNTLFVDFNGVSTPAKEIYESANPNVSYLQFKRRIKNGMSIHDAISIPSLKRKLKT